MSGSVIQCSNCGCNSYTDPCLQCSNDVRLTPAEIDKVLSEQPLSSDMSDDELDLWMKQNQDKVGYTRDF